MKRMPFSPKFPPNPPKSFWDNKTASYRPDVNDINVFIPFDKYVDEFSKKDIGQSKIKRLYRKEYYNHMLKHSLLPKNEKYLPFYFQNKLKDYEESNVAMSEMWPIKCRKRPVISLPKNIFELPLEPHRMTKNLIDWGKTGYMAYVYKQEVYVHSPENTVDPFWTSTCGKVGNCLKWNKEGTSMAVRLEMQQNDCVAVYEPFFNKKIFLSNYRDAKRNRSEIMCLEYTSKNLLAGMANGRILIWSLDLNPVYIDSFKAHSKAVLGIKVSCREHFIISYGNDQRVRIWEMRERKPLLELSLNPDCDYCNCFDWHPWKESIFVISCGHQAMYQVIDVSKQKNNVLSNERSTTSEYCVIHDLKFNPCSAELVMAYTKTKRDGQEFTPNVIVLGAHGNVVDELSCHESSVFCLLWNPDGSKLATGGEDENLIIWSFFEEKQYKKEVLEDMKWGLFPSSLR